VDAVTPSFATTLLRAMIAAVAAGAVARPAAAQLLPQVDLKAAWGTGYLYDGDGQASGTMVLASGTLRWRAVALRVQDAYASRMRGLRADSADVGRVDAEVEHLQADLIAGTRTAAIIAGYSWRLFCTQDAEGFELECSDWRFPTMGAQAGFTFGGSGVTTTLSARIYLNVLTSTSDERISGREFEGELRYRHGVTPFFVSAGYRLEAFAATGADRDLLHDRSFIFIGGGLMFEPAPRRAVPVEPAPPPPPSTPHGSLQSRL
jgi:hypothetical protein